MNSVSALGRKASWFICGQSLFLSPRKRTLAKHFFKGYKKATQTYPYTCQALTQTPKVFVSVCACIHVVWGFTIF